MTDSTTIPTETMTRIGVMTYLHIIRGDLTYSLMMGHGTFTLTTIIGGDLIPHEDSEGTFWTHQGGEILNTKTGTILHLDLYPIPGDEDNLLEGTITGIHQDKYGTYLIFDSDRIIPLEDIETIY